jgi:hypothetical protein
MQSNQKKSSILLGLGLLFVPALAALFFGACPNPESPEPGPATPVITVQPQGAVYGLNAVSAALTVTASVSDGGTLSYQWRSNGSDTEEEGSPVGDNLPYFTPPVNVVGTAWHYVEVTNTLGGKTASAKSLRAKIEVTDLIAWTATVDGSENETTSTAIVFTFSRDPGNVSVADIAIVNGSGAATKGGALTPDAGRTVWTLALAAVETAGNLTVSVAKEGVHGDSQTVAVYKAGQANPIDYTVTLYGDTDRGRGRHGGHHSPEVYL